ncbi:MAG: FCD domain-containing protein [Synergistaceae bacterium]|nr:FCD domain-containing protein [Synergistaceae bacterium]
MALTDLEYNLLDIIEGSASPLGPNALALKLKGREITVSAPTVGRCLASLEEAGYLISVENRGRIISEEGRSVLYRHHLQQNLSDAAQNVVDILGSSGSANIQKLIDVVTTRQALERKAAWLAAKNATAEEITTICTYGDILDTLLKDIHDSHGKNHQAAAMGRLFHETIAKAGKNEVLAAMIHLVNQDIAARDFLVVLLEQTNYSFGLGHAAIARAIKNRDPELARALAEEHTQKILDALSLLL